MNLPQEFTELLDECAELIDDSGLVESQQTLPVVEPLPSLLGRCVELVEQEPTVEPVRTIHHFACSGGTLFTKCLASMPNTKILSEVEPHSRIPLQGARQFFPSDLIQLLRVGTYPSNERLETQIFLRGLEAIYEDSLRLGLRLVLRDHPHSKYCVGPAQEHGPNLHAIVSGCLPTRSVVTVRHPVDSFLSLKQRGWIDFTPDDFDEYCKRYLQFLSDHADLPLFKYEALVATPSDVMASICEALTLPFDHQFESNFLVHKISGDSGRTGSVITSRARRAVSESMAAEAEASGSYGELCRALDYETELLVDAT